MLEQLLTAVPMVLVAVLNLGALLNCVRTPAERVRYVPKLLWLLFILSTSLIGALAWLYLGKRPKPSESLPHETMPSENIRSTTKGPAHRAGPLVHQR
ncbi:PLD nuclease N-terminal domain-containing protein [Streptomyces sp. NBC_01485]|uniref:PLD nuclease N-terminal domain-containing protein n=1 Tax=Streptomyces sp. NBC_01485 TaxID=2903884 RepID=UPI002E2EC581|nr:PLD nuclease N-terminal domain-containing protein [Streptomyces sp. NBC_01485]